MEARSHKAAKKAVRRLTAGLERGDDELLHKARKAGKRARYAGELLARAGVKDPLATDGRRDVLEGPAGRAR